MLFLHLGDEHFLQVYGSICCIQSKYYQHSVQVKDGSAHSVARHTPRSQVEEEDSM